MNFKQMHYFVEVAEAGGFSKASYRLSLAQSALSRHIRLLEEELGTKLLTRTGRGVKLTEQGEFLLEQAKDILQKKKETEQALSTWHAYPNGLVRIGMPPTTVLSSAAKIINAVHTAHPAISIDISENISKDISDLLSTGRLDLGIVLEKRPPENLEAELIAMEELCLVTSKSIALKEPVSIKDIEKLPLIFPSKYGRFQATIERAAAAEGIQLVPAFKLNAMPAIKDLVLTGAGVAILPRSAVHREVDRKEVSAYQIKAKNMKVPVYLAYVAGNPLGRAPLAVAHIVREILSTSLKKS